MLRDLLSRDGAAASHPQSDALEPAPNPQVARDKGIIRVMEPWLTAAESDAVAAVMKTEFISSASPMVGAFEAKLAEVCGTEHAFAVTCGTHALDLVLHCLDVGPADEVIVPAFGFISVAACVARRGARCVFVDIDRHSLNLQPALVEAAITPRTRGIIGVHTYGHPADMDALDAIATRHELFLLEDACEAIGASLRGRPIGGLGDVGVHSFYANKMMTTGNGGAITTNDADLAALISDLRGYSYAPDRFFWHHHLPFNVRMSALQAAVGLTQLERLPTLLAARRQMVNGYNTRLANLPGLRLPARSTIGESVHWMYTVHVDPSVFPMDAASLRMKLAAGGVETRPAFSPLHVQPVLQATAAPPQGPFPNAEWAALTGINLPSSPRLSAEDLDHICQLIAS